MAVVTNTLNQNSITECSICNEELSNPRVLPCIHTFCLKCLHGWSKNKHSGDPVSCPTCRQEFIVPSGGLSCLPMNYFIEKLLKSDKIAETTRYCEICCDDCQAEVSMFCIDCQQPMCDQCARCHTKQRFTKTHNIVTIESDAKHKKAASLCDQHPTEVVKLYCNECKAVICVSCFAEVHQSHKCSNIEKVVEEFANQLLTDNCRLTEVMAETLKTKQKYKKRKNKFAEKVGAIREELMIKRDELKHLIDLHAYEVLQELDATENEQLKTFANINDELEQQLMVVGNFRTYCEEVRDKGSLRDIAQHASDLHKRANQLRKLHLDQDESYSADINFTSTGLEDALMGDNLVGKLTLKIYKLSTVVDTEFVMTPQLIHTSPTGKAIRGVTCLNNDVYIVREGMSLVEVYDVNTFTLHHSITVCGLIGPSDMTASFCTNCLYISDYGSKCIFRVGVDVGVGWKRNDINAWSMIGHPQSLYMTNHGSIIVTMDLPSKIIELRQDGQVVREIALQSDISDLLHSAVLPSGEILVSHGGQKHRVCMLGRSECPRQVYGCEPGSADGQLDSPHHLAVDKQGFVLVADSNNRRIILLTPLLTFVRELILPESLHQGPVRLCLDELRGLLYIGDYNSSDGCVYVFRVKKSDYQNKTNVVSKPTLGGLETASVNNVSSEFATTTNFPFCLSNHSSQPTQQCITIKPKKKKVPTATLR